jgi:hypothetical protein
MWRSGVTLVTWFKLVDARNTAPWPECRYQSGFYTSGGTVKPSHQAFRFPFAAFVWRDRLTVWGRTPASRAGLVRVERKTRGGWRLLTRLSANRYGTFTRTMRTRLRAGWLRARLAPAGEASRAFSLTRPGSRSIHPFGSRTCPGQSALAQGPTSGPPSIKPIVGLAPVDQYIEEVPTAGGSTPSGRGEEEPAAGGSAALPPSVLAEIESQAGSDAAKLNDIATSVAYGAPQNVGGSLDPTTSQFASGSAGAIAATGSAFEGEGGGRLGGLLLAMTVIGAVAGALAVRRTRGGRSRAI